MKVYDSREIRNVALIGHGDSGKTTVASAMLYSAGAVNRLGRVDDGNTVTDYDEDEISRQITINSVVAHCEWGSTKINIIDTPGYPAFILDAKSSLMGADSALLVVDSTSGVEVQSEKAWEFAEEHRLARAVVFNKLDRDLASFERSLESVHKSFGRTVVPVQIPLGEEASFRGIIDLIGEKAYVYELDGSGNFQETAIPDELQAEAERRREELIEMVAESDDDLMEKYFEEGTLTQSELVQGLRSFFVDQSIVPRILRVGGKERRGQAAHGRHGGSFPQSPGKGSRPGSDGRIGGGSGTLHLRGRPRHGLRLQDPGRSLCRADQFGEGDHRHRQIGHEPAQPDRRIQRTAGVRSTFPRERATNLCRNSGPETWAP